MAKVTQLDAGLLDEEYQRMLLGQVERLVWGKPEVRKWLETALLAGYELATLWRGLQTPGLETYKLQYGLGTGWERVGRLLIHLVAVLVPKITVGIEQFAWIQRLWMAFSVINFAVFLRFGRYPTLADRLSGLQITPAPSNTGRLIDFAYTNRFVLVSTLFSFLRALTPHLQLSALFSFLSSESLSTGPAARRCCLCASDHVVCPTRYPCGHQACYYCKATRPAGCPACS